MNLKLFAFFFSLITTFPFKFLHWQIFFLLTVGGNHSILLAYGNILAKWNRLTIITIFLKYAPTRGIPCGKESTCQCRRHEFDPWDRKIPWRRKWQPTPVFLPGNFQGQRSLVCGVSRVRHDWGLNNNPVWGSCCFVLHRVCFWNRAWSTVGNYIAKWKLWSKYAHGFIWPNTS